MEGLPLRVMVIVIVQVLFANRHLNFCYFLLRCARTRKAKRKGHREVDWLRSLRRVKTEKAKSENADGEDLKDTDTWLLDWV